MFDSVNLDHESSRIYVIKKVLIGLPIHKSPKIYGEYNESSMTECGDA